MWELIIRRSSVGCGAAVGVLTGFLLATAGWAGPTGRITVAGYGPELPMIQDLAKAFERANPGAAIDIEWEKNVKAVDLVKEGKAQIAVTDQEVPELKGVPIATDGIAVIVNFTNPIKEVTSEQVKALFTGKFRHWSELDGADVKIDVVDRTPFDNVKLGFESSLGIAGHVQAAGKPVRTDQRALSAVSGKDSAISYISLKSALKAQEDGTPIRLLVIDKVEPGEPTIADGRYKLRRSVFFLTGKQPDPITEAFVAFAQSAEGQKLVRLMFSPYVGETVSKQAQSKGKEREG